MAYDQSGHLVKNSPRAPFDDEDADIIFRSSDDVDFRVYRVVLAKASPVFRTMLQLPQPSSTSTAPSVQDEPHVITLTEDAKTLENVLRLCYPVEHPSITSVDDIRDILEATRKYELTSVSANLRLHMKQILPKEPLRIYAIAYMFEMEDVAKDAATFLLDDPQFHIPPSPPPEFSALPGLALYAVHMYRQNCAAAILRVIAKEDWTSRTFIWSTCNHIPGVQMQIGSRSVYVRKWFDVYSNSLKDALRERPSGRTVRSFPTSAGASDAISQTSPCINCAAKGPGDLMRFSEWLGGKVDDAIAQVSQYACAPV